MKKVILLFFIIFAVYIVFAGYQKRIFVKPQATIKTTNGLITVNQTINKNTKNYQIPQGKTALELLEKTSVIITNGKGKDAFVESITKVKADSLKKEYWAFYVNGQQATVGAGSYYLKPNDNIEWKIEKY